MTLNNFRYVFHSVIIYQKLYLINLIFLYIQMILHVDYYNNQNPKWPYFNEFLVVSLEWKKNLEVDFFDQGSKHMSSSWYKLSNFSLKTLYYFPLWSFLWILKMYKQTKKSLILASLKTGSRFPIKFYFHSSVKSWYNWQVNLNRYYMVNKQKFSFIF